MWSLKLDSKCTKNRVIPMKLSAILVTLMLSVPAMGNAQLLHKSLPWLKSQMNITLQPLVIEEWSLVLIQHKKSMMT